VGFFSFVFLAAPAVSLPGKRGRRKKQPAKSGLEAEKEGVEKRKSKGRRAQKLIFAFLWGGGGEHVQHWEKKEEARLFSW